MMLIKLLRYLAVLGMMTICTLNPQLVLAKDQQFIRRANSLPETTPWNLKELSIPPEFKWDEGTKVRSLKYQSEHHKGKTTSVFAYYATPGSLANNPALDKNLPAIVLVHGGGGKAFEQWAQLWAKRGYAAIAMDLSGQHPNSGPDQSHESKFDTISGEVTDQWTYHAVANVIRAHSLIRSFPEVNENRTAITGISWGGYLTCIVAGLDNRFKAAIPVYGCGFLHENSSWLGQFEKMSAENRTKWIQLWEPSQYVGSTTIPILFVNGGRDFHYRPDSYAKTYALVQSPKNIRFTPVLPHGHIFDRPKAIETFVNHHLNGGIPLPRIHSLNANDNEITAHVESKKKLISAKLHYSTDTIPGDDKARKWMQMPVNINKLKLSCERPPENAVVWFLTITDERKVTVSSQLILPQH